MLNSDDIKCYRATFERYNDQNLAVGMVSLAVMGLNCVDEIEILQKENERLKQENEKLQATMLRMAEYISDGDTDEDICKGNSNCTSDEYGTGTNEDCWNCIIKHFEECE